MIRTVCEEAKLKRICIKKRQANYMNTLAQRESDSTFNAGLSSWIHKEEYKWSSVLSTQSIQEKVQNFQCALMQMYNDCFPVKTVLMSSRDPPCMSPLVKHLLKRRQVLFRKGRQKKNPNVTVLQERINKLIRDNQLRAVKYDSNKHDMGTRSWWSTINSITGRKSICQSIS